jgi:G3E family GTPase
MTLEQMECSIAGIIDQVEVLETRAPATDQDKLLDDTREDDHDKEDEMEEVDNEEPLNPPPPHHHDGSNVMTNRCTKSFHTLCVDQIGKVWEATLIVVLTNCTLAVMMILSLKLSL